MSATASISLSETAIVRFWSKVEKGEGCWTWTGAAGGSHGDRNYGIVAVDRKPRYAHRVSYTLSKGAIPNGAMVLHACDNELCVRPSHLFTGSAHDNWMDAKRKGRAPQGFKVGHVMSEATRRKIGDAVRARRARSDTKAGGDAGDARPFSVS